MVRHVRSPHLVGVILCMLVLALAACGGNPSASTPTAQPIASTTVSETAEVTQETTAETTVMDVTEEVTAETTAVDATTEATAEETAAVAAATCTKLNLNDMTEEDLLATIPNFSNRMVREFFEYQPYVSIQQFRREIGKYVDEATVADYEQYVYVPIDVNNADADTLTQIPGVDDTLANTLVSGRPYTNNQAFLDALAELMDANQVAGAECYLAAEA